MNAIDIVKLAQEGSFTDPKGRRGCIKLKPPLSETELTEFEAQLPCKLTKEMKELLQYCSGLELDFTNSFLNSSLSFSCEQEDCFGAEFMSANCIPLIGDYCGNFWVADITEDSTDFGPIYYVCHDPPVVVYQAAELTQFLTELFKLGNAPWTSEISEVHETFAMSIQSENPNALSHEQCLASNDDDLKTFAGSLDESYLFIDLRKPTLGSGFYWGMFGADTVIKRFGAKRVFAIQKKKLNWFQKIFGP